MANRNVFLMLGVAPPAGMGFRSLPKRDPTERRFRYGRQKPYAGYLDRMAGDYCMDHNKHDVRAALKSSGSTP